MGAVIGLSADLVFSSVLNIYSKQMAREEPYSIFFAA